MKVYFRELTIADIPAIKDISKDIWEGDDYIPYVIDEWLQDKNCMNYGTFKDENKTELIGLNLFHGIYLITFILFVIKPEIILTFSLIWVPIWLIFSTHKIVG